MPHCDRELYNTHSAFASLEMRTCTCCLLQDRPRPREQWTVLLIAHRNTCADPHAFRCVCVCVHVNNRRNRQRICRRPNTTQPIPVDWSCRIRSELSPCARQQTQITPTIKRLMRVTHIAEPHTHTFPRHWRASRTLVEIVDKSGRAAGYICEGVRQVSIYCNGVPGPESVFSIQSTYKPAGILLNTAQI